MIRELSLPRLDSRISQAMATRYYSLPLTRFSYERFIRRGEIYFGFRGRIQF
jgi:hypothetical protein